MVACLSAPQTEEDIVDVNKTQKIFVISPPHAGNAESCAKVKQIRVGEKLHEVSTYVTPHGDTWRVVRGIDPELSDDRLGEVYVHARNPKVLGVRRIKKTPMVIILIERMKVPNYVMCGTTLIRCTLYRRQIDACQTCGKLGHRSDVCPTPTVITCRKCGISSPLENNTCQPTCFICGGAHPTADRACKSRYQVPYIVRHRRRRRRKAKNRVGTSCHSKQPGLGSTRGMSQVPLGGARVTALARGIGRPPVSGFSKDLPGLIDEFIDSMKPHCPHCDERRCASSHVLWQCTSLRDGEPLTTADAWKTVISSSDREIQIRAVQRARSLGERHALPAPTWVRPTTNPPS
ncbi:hypothetical protein HPB51_023007 [Rhipicephalus microplus]|uniref:CCHC-type domain-containing protein n=1 Tax=Rhipicephalus microplus TaxID=6941 RepID=A0A9J6D834_RHIMP|nr:hypothetical protein HPB51_023007 [Rhipicephalus microplus]